MGWFHTPPEGTREYRYEAAVKVRDIFLAHHYFAAVAGGQLPDRKSWQTYVRGLN